MITTTLPQPNAPPVPEELRPTATGPILVASDGESGTDAALTAAFLLAGRFNADVEVVAAIEPLIAVGRFVPPPTADAERERSLRARIDRQIATTIGRESGWPVHLRRGSPAATIADQARLSRARLIVLGRGPRDLAHWLLGGELALEVARLVDIPILCVAPPFHEYPRRAVIGLDFGDRSLAAARGALAIMQEFATVYLAHVTPRFEDAFGVDEDMEAKYDAGVAEAFAQVRRQVDLPEEAIVETLTLRGDPARALLEAAAQAGADLIVCGTHGRGFMQRMVLGSVASRLLRGAACSVLLVPNSRPESTIALTDWASELQRFTDRNASRLAILEIDDPAIGAQAQVLDFPFIGAAWDPRTTRIELMLGGPRPDVPHLTHVIDGATSLDVLVGGDGRDRVLCATHAAGKTLLTFTT
ncbi:MAG TPA: universal stress protein [Gemmatimonadaceae bacterium]|nr:universal stress protein [Gemmatimonadaceae bacterium]